MTMRLARSPVAPKRTKTVGAGGTAAVWCFIVAMTVNLRGRRAIGLASAACPAGCHPPWPHGQAKASRADRRRSGPDTGKGQAGLLRLVPPRLWRRFAGRRVPTGRDRCGGPAPPALLVRDRLRPGDRATGSPDVTFLAKRLPAGRPDWRYVRAGRASRPAGAKTRGRYPSWSRRRVRWAISA